MQSIMYKISFYVQCDSTICIQQQLCIYLLNPTFEPVLEKLVSKNFKQFVKTSRLQLIFKSFQFKKKKKKSNIILIKKVLQCLNCFLTLRFAS